MSDDPIVWFVGTDADADVLSTAEARFVTVLLKEAHWGTPRGTRAAGLAMVVAEGESTESATARVRQLRRRAQGAMLVGTIGACDADLQRLLLRAGASEVLRSPTDPSLNEGAARRAHMRWSRAVRKLLEAPPPKLSPPTKSAPKLILIGSSTGGPDVLKQILTGLRFRMPVLISQHIQPGYAEGLAEWLTEAGAPARLATDRAPLLPGVALVAPGNKDMIVEERRVRLVPPSTTAVPCVDVMFRTAAEVFRDQAVGILLTGMGADGAQGMLTMRQSGAYTITQAGHTNTVDGMPAAARALDASCEEWTPRRIKAWLRLHADAIPVPDTALKAVSNA